MCQARVSNQSVFQERLRVLRESVLPECATKVSGKNVSQECPTKVSHKSMPQECHKRVSHKIVQEECQPRVFCKSGVQCDPASPVRFSLFCRNPSSTWVWKKCMRVRGFYQVFSTSVWTADLWPLFCRATGSTSRRGWGLSTLVTSGKCGCQAELCRGVSPARAQRDHGVGTCPYPWRQEMSGETEKYWPPWIQGDHHFWPKK